VGVAWGGVVSSVLGGQGRDSEGEQKGGEGRAEAGVREDWHPEQSSGKRVIGPEWAGGDAVKCGHERS
jgi:hypothetical protein